MSSKVDRSQSKRKRASELQGTGRGERVRLNTAASASHPSFIVCYGNFFLVALALEHWSFHGSTVRSSADETDHRGAVLTPRAVEAANPLIGKLTQFSGGSYLEPVLRASSFFK